MDTTLIGQANEVLLEFLNACFAKRGVGPSKSSEAVPRLRRCDSES
jgi:hypothetical protein